jgi:hypothetical protein
VGECLVPNVCYGTKGIMIGADLNSRPDFRRPPRSRRDLRSSGKLCTV